MGHERGEVGGWATAVKGSDRTSFGSSKTAAAMQGRMASCSNPFPKRRNKLFEAVLALCFGKSCTVLYWTIATARVIISSECASLCLLCTLLLLLPNNIS
jgi:hypothetical protein